MVLRAVANLIVAEVRACDSVGRYGGEEFVVLLTRTTATVACAVAERIRTAIGSLQLTTPTGEPMDAISASIGVAMYPAQGRTVDRLVAAADGALYRAKAEGRNRVASATS